MEEIDNNCDVLNFDDEAYYAALQNSLQSYDAKLWLIPGLFFVIIGLLVDGLDKINFFHSLENGITLILGALLIALLLFYYYKAHIFFLLIQKKIDEFDKYFNQKDKKIERIPLASMPEKDLIKRLAELVSVEELDVSPMQWLLVRVRVSFCVKSAMIIAFLASLTLGIINLWK